MFKFQWKKRSGNPAYGSEKHHEGGCIWAESCMTVRRYLPGRWGNKASPPRQWKTQTCTKARDGSQTLHSFNELQRKMLGEPPLKSFTLAVMAVPDTLKISTLLTILLQIQVASSRIQFLTFLNKRGLHHSLSTALLISPSWGYVKHPRRVCLLTACLLLSRPEAPRGSNPCSWSVPSYPLHMQNI